MEHKFIDVIVTGQGEEAFLSLLKLIHNKKPLPPVIKGHMLNDLDSLPSPYLTGLFDKIIADNSQAVWQMTLETDRGCPFGCTFCDWGSSTKSTIKQFGLDRVKSEIDWASNNPITYIFCADANFGILKDRAFEIAEYMQKKLCSSMVDVVCLQYTKNNNTAVVDIAKSMGRLNRGLSLSAQSMSTKTLAAINRSNLDINKFSQIIDAAQQHDIPTYSELILGLPEETVESWRDGFDRLLEGGQHQSIEVLNAQLFNNAELSSKASREKYGIQTIQVKDFMSIFNKADEVHEYVEVVNGTNSMTTDELIDCYMYSWMMVNFHIAGFTQVIATECRRKAVQYRIFYDALYEKIKTNDLLKKQYLDVKESVTAYLTVPGGTLRQTFLYGASYDFMYNNKDEIFRLGMQVHEDVIGKKDDLLKQIQEAFIYDPSHNYPIQLSYSGREYHIDCKFKNKGDVFALRRKGGLYKNRLRVLGGDE